MTVHSKDEALMCKVFPPNLGPVAMRWFNGLRANSITPLRNSPGPLVLALSLVAGFLGLWDPYYICLCGGGNFEGLLR